jgi:hypothetical protein
MILDRLIDKVGDSNPQIFRELKERITARNISIAIVAALIIQGFVLLYFNSQIPIPSYEIASPYKLEETNSIYCGFEIKDRYASLCELNEAGGFKINWQRWWSNVFTCLSWILPLGLILGSVYTLVADLVQEEKRGTLNFIRLSPQSARNIFIGKILGVPMLVYLAVAMMLPLHLGAGTIAGASLALLASWYVTIGSIWFLFSSAAVLYVLLGGIQAILTVIAVAYPVYLPLLVVNAFVSGTINRDEWLDRTNEYLSWFGLPVMGNAILFCMFGTGCCLVASYWVWEALERRYLNPTATVIGKSQSYLANICLQIWIAGFVVPLIFQAYSYSKESGIIGFAVIDFMALLLLIPMLLPSKQAIQDWSRYRRERVTHQHRQFWKRELVRDLINDDKSPALLAIAINLGIAMLLWVPTSIIAFSSITNGTRFLAGMCLAASLTLIYTAISHLGLFLNVKKRNLWIAASIVIMMILPPVGAYVLSPSHAPTGLAAILLLFSPFAGAGILQLAGGTILATFAAQLAMLAALTHQLQRKLQISGQSQSKELLAHS